MPKSTTNCLEAFYTNKQNAKRAAKKQLGEDFLETHTLDKGTDGRWSVNPIPVEEPELGRSLYMQTVGRATGPDSTEKRKKDKSHLRGASSIKGPVAAVWNIAEECYAKGMKRKDTIQVCVDAGIAFYTARTQYQAWFKAMKASS